MLADGIGSHSPLPVGPSTHPYYSGDRAAHVHDEDFIDGWRALEDIASGHFAADDYDFKKPKALLDTRQQQPAGHPQDSREIYDWPGGYTEVGDGENYARVRIEQLKAEREVMHGFGNARNLAPGYPRPGATGNTTGIVYPQTDPGPPGGNTNPPVQPETEQEKGWWQRWGSTATHTVLDVAGLVPGLGTVTSLVDAGIYAAEGDMVSAGISAAMAVPIAGNIGRGGKLAVRGGKAVAEQAGKKAAQEAAEAAAKAAKQGTKHAEKKVTQKAAGKEGGHVKPKSLRDQYLGRTPGKNSRTGKEVQERMRKEGKLRDGPDGPEFKASDGEWYPLKDADMAHNKDAVKWWNESGREFGAKSKEVRDWMLDSNNYTLDHYGINRSAGAKLPDRYLPPLK